MIFLGIDNGVSGSIGLIRPGGVATYVKMPTLESLSYTKAKKFINRVDWKTLFAILGAESGPYFCMIERPMVQAARFNATLSAIRAVEATLIVLEKLCIPYEFVDSKQWQRALLPSGIWTMEKDKNGRGYLKAFPDDLKKASFSVGKRLFPSVNFAGFTDADGLLIAEYARRTHGASSPPMSGKVR